MNAQELFDIKGKKAIVTGGTRGLGYGMAEGLMEVGCEVVIVGTSDKVFDVAGEFCGRGFVCHGVKADLATREQVYQCFEACLKELNGDLDILVTAHGIQRRHSAEEFPLEEWDEVLNVNLNSVFILCQEAGKVMLKKGYGKIINIASMISWFGGQTIPAYAAAKGGVTQLTKELSNDWMARGINVNAIAPGYMETAMNAALLDPANPRYQQITDRIAAKRWGTGDDMKGACIFLASHASDYLGGAIIPVDGGYLVK
ncbi:MAG: SDR family oxidoreductase [Lachnospiraceae bacterium]|nr:SDR family oxidoreductase [Lachnospiraceae bacterium]